MKSISKLLLEFIPVLFGVLIALTINDCNASRKANNLRTKTIEIIQKKSLANVEDMKSVIENHQLIIDFLDNPANEKLEIIEILSKADGFKNSNLKTLPRLVEIKSDIDFEINSQLENLEKQTLFLIKRNDNIMEFILENINSNNPNSKEKLAFNFKAYVNSEFETINDFKALIDYIAQQ